MADYFEFRPTEDNIGDLREHSRDESLIDAFAKWIDRGDELDSLIRQIEIAFADLPLGDGTGLLEAKGLDDYAAKSELEKLRTRDEHSDWRLIEVETLNRCYGCPIIYELTGIRFSSSSVLDCRTQ